MVRINYTYYQATIENVIKNVLYIPFFIKNKFNTKKHADKSIATTKYDVISILDFFFTYKIILFKLVFHNKNSLR